MSAARRFAVAATFTGALPHAAGLRAAVACALVLTAMPVRGAEPTSSSLPELARKLSDAIARRAESPIALYVEGGTPELQRGLATHLAAALGERRHAVVPVSATSADEAERNARNLGARSLARVSLAVEGGELRARGDLVGTWVNFWSGDLATRPPKLAGAFAEAVPLDALALGMVASPLPSAGRATALRLDVLAELTARPAAIAGGDLDGDGRAEVAVLTDEELIVLSPEGRVLARRPHRSLGDASAPSREPFGAVAIDSARKQVLAYSARRARGEAVRLQGAELVPVAQLSAPPLTAGAIGELVPGQNVFAPDVRFEGGKTWSAGAPFHTLVRSAEHLLTTHPGATARWTPAGASQAVLVDGLGASGLADLDGDARPELIASQPEYLPGPERVGVLELPAPAPTGAVSAGAFTSRLELTLPRGRVTAVSPADLDGKGGDEVLLGVWLPDGRGELLVIRRAGR